MKLQQNNNLFVYIILIFSMLFWGTSFVFTTIALEILDPISIVFIRLLISTVMLWIIVAIFFRKEKISFSLFKWIAVLAFFEPFIYFIGETYGLQRVSPVVTSLIIATIPVFTAIVMQLFFRVKLTTINFIGIFISLSGVVLILVGKNMQFDVDILGLLLLFLAVFAAVGYGILLNKLVSNVHPIWLITAQNTFGTLFFLPLYLVLRKTPNFDYATVFTFLSPQGEIWTCILLLSIFSSSLAFIFYSMAVRKIGIVRGIVFANLIPIFTAITSFFLLGEHLSITKIAGIFIVIFGLMLTQRKKYNFNLNF
jgi:drug/metabolite transporter (DMT)-like permease